VQQILKFKIEIFDVRMRTSISIIDDTALVRSIQINKGTSLDNTATITFQKSKTYDLLPMETTLKLYNYVKIEMELKNYNPSNVVNGKGEMFYFSGFIQTINKQAQFGTTPSAAVTITISDYANLMKTTFYTKNLTFLEILNQAVPEFRMINFSEYLGDKKNDLLNSFYSPTQMGFIFFAFIYFKFMYKMVYDEEGKTKRTYSPAGQEIFKKFKIYMPFGFEIPNIKNGATMLKGQETGLMIYKQLQGVALDLFKYLYPEPIFEFTTFETVDSVILMIRFTPLMKFDRPLLPPRNITFGNAESNNLEEAVFHEKTAQTQGYAFDLDSYNVIEHKDFGYEKIKAITQSGEANSPAELLKAHLDDKNILNMLSENLNEVKHLKVEDLIANDTESNKITELFFNVIKINTQYLESLSMTRNASSVVNVIWTVPTTDTAVLKMSGRELVFAYMQQRLQEVGGDDQFGNYIYNQFNHGFNANPVFLMDYRGVFGQDFVSGDMNYFGFREFEVKWNYLSIENGMIGHILKYVDISTLAAAKKGCADSKVVRAIDDAIRANSPVTQQTTSLKNKPRKQKYVFNAYASVKLPDFSKSFSEIITPKAPGNYLQSIINTSMPKPSKNKKPDLKKAMADKDFTDALRRYGVKIEDLKNADKIIELIRRAKDEDTRFMGGFVGELNGIIASAYRENEHLYDCQILKPIDLSILPGMVVESEGVSMKSSSPRFKGYVTSISHSVDFGAATMKTNINISRTASDDSAVYPTVYST